MAPPSRASRARRSSSWTAPTPARRQGPVDHGRGSTVRGLVINRFSGSGIALTGGGGNIVRSNYIGTNVAGTAGLGNGDRGVLLLSSDNTVGGSCTGEGNVISDNGLGIGIAGVSTTRNLVAGNRIGTNAAGTVALGNRSDGIEIFRSPGNTIGGTAAGAHNVISGNADVGVDIASEAAVNNVVVGNSIGTNAAGDRGLSNGSGVNIVDTSDNLIGGTAPVRATSSPATSTTAFGSYPTGRHGNLVQGNFIGTDISGTTALANDFGLPEGNVNTGVRIRNASNNTIGGVTPGSRNLISGNFDFIAGTGVAGVLIEVGGRPATWCRATSSAPTSPAPAPSPMRMEWSSPSRRPPRSADRPPRGQSDLGERVRDRRDDRRGGRHVGHGGAGESDRHRRHRHRLPAEFQRRLIIDASANTIGGTTPGPATSSPSTRPPRPEYSSGGGRATPSCPTRSSRTADWVSTCWRATRAPASRPMMWATGTPAPTTCRTIPS